MAFSGNSSEFPYRGGILALQGDFYLQGGIVLFTGRYLLIAPLNILTCDFKTRRERALKAAIRGQYEYYRRVDFSFLYCHTSHTLLMSRWKYIFVDLNSPLGGVLSWAPATGLDSQNYREFPGIHGNSRESWEFPRPLYKTGNSPPLDTMILPRIMLLAAFTIKSSW